MSEKYILNEDDLRYQIKIGRFGSYFYDSKLKKDIDLGETKWILNQFELKRNEFVKDLKKLPYHENVSEVRNIIKKWEDR